MSLWSSLTTDIKIDSLYGDIEIYGGDIVLSKKRKEILINTVIDRYKTSFNDYLLLPNYGANLDIFIGRGIDNKLIEDIKTTFRYALTYDNFVDNTELEIIAVKIDNTIEIHTYITTDQEEVAITATYSREGLSFD